MKKGSRKGEEGIQEVKEAAIGERDRRGGEETKWLEIERGKEIMEDGTGGSWWELMLEEEGEEWRKVKKEEEKEAREERRR